MLGRHAIANAGPYSVVCAIQNLWLAATAEGFGVGWVSFYREEFLRELVGFPAHVRPVAWLCVGSVADLPEVPDLERFGWRHRSPLAEVLHEERYQPRMWAHWVTVRAGVQPVNRPTGATVSTAIRVSSPPCSA